MLAKSIHKPLHGHKKIKIITYVWPLKDWDTDICPWAEPHLITGSI